MIFFEYFKVGTVYFSQIVSLQLSQNLSLTLMHLNNSINDEKHEIW